MCQKTSRPRALLTPEQQAAMQFLTSYMQQGQTPYSGSFEVAPQGLEEFVRATLGGSGAPDLGFDTSALQELARTGVPFDQQEMFQKQRQVAEQAATKAFEQKLAESARFGARYSTPAIAAAAHEAANVQAQTELGILQQMAREHELAQQRKIQAAQALMSGVNAARTLGVDASRVLLAANQFRQGMTYEEFKRQFPDVYQVATAVFGRNIDFYTKTSGYNYLPLALTVIGGVLGAFLGGPAGAAIGASLAGGAGAGASGSTR